MIAVSHGVKYIQGMTGVLVLMLGLAATGMAQDATSSDVFRVGDRIALTVEPPLAIRDTFVVRDGLVFSIPNVGEISLKGVRRADAQKSLTQQLSKYVRDPVVKAVVLIRIGVLGPVGRPGYYVVPADAIVSDVIMGAGGPSQAADPSKTVIRRDGKELVGKAAVSQALATGKTLDNLGVAPGDELVVGERSARSMQTYLQFASVLLGLGIAIISLAGR